MRVQKNATKATVTRYGIPTSFDNMFEISQIGAVSGYNVWGCFAGFVSTEQRDDLVFSFPMLHREVGALIEEFNSVMQNVKIRVLHTKIVRIYKEDRGEFSTTYVVTEDDKNFKDSNEEYVWHAFNIEFLGKYNPSAKLQMQYFLHHLLRTFSVGEGLFGENLPLLKKGFTDQVIVSAVSLFNQEFHNVSSVRELWELPLDPNIIFNLDDVVFVNRVFSSGAKQTAIGLRLAKNYQHGILEGENLYFSTLPRIGMYKMVDFYYLDRESDRMVSGVLRAKVSNLSRVFSFSTNNLVSIGGLERINTDWFVPVGNLLSMLDQNHPSVKLMELIPIIEEFHKKIANGLSKPEYEVVRAKVGENYVHFSRTENAFKSIANGSSVKKMFRLKRIYTFDIGE